MGLLLGTMARAVDARHEEDPDVGSVGEALCVVTRAAREKERLVADSPHCVGKCVDHGDVEKGGSTPGQHGHSYVDRATLGDLGACRAHSFDDPLHARQLDAAYVDEHVGFAGDDVDRPGPRDDACTRRYGCGSSFASTG